MYIYKYYNSTDNQLYGHDQIDTIFAQTIVLHLNEASPTLSMVNIERELISTIETTLQHFKTTSVSTLEVTLSEFPYLAKHYVVPALQRMQPYKYKYTFIHKLYCTNSTLKVYYLVFSNTPINIPPS